MENLNDLILYENENVRLDFKRDEYVKEEYSSFLKDIIAIANAFTKDERFIIIGLKPTSSHERGIVGIQGKLTDAATFQQIVYENIEPELSIEYFSYNLEKYVFGVFRISSCSNPPYLMKKDYGNGKNKLYRGGGFIRKGSHQTRLTRADIDKYFKIRANDNSFDGQVIFSFVSGTSENTLLLKSLKQIKRPSQIKKEKIERILEKKKKEADLYSTMGIKGFHTDFLGNSIAQQLASISGKGVPYENRDISTLEENLKKVEQTYLKHDYYELFEKQASKYNFIVFNKGNKYIEDASLIIKIPKIDGIIVSSQVYDDPDNDSIVGSINSANMYYPNVKEDDEFYIIEDHVGNINHQKPMEALKEPIRILASDKIEIETFNINLELYAKNILTKINEELTIKCQKIDLDQDIT